MANEWLRARLLPWLTSDLSKHSVNTYRARIEERQSDRTYKPCFFCGKDRYNVVKILRNKWVSSFKFSVLLVVIIIVLLSLK